MEIYKTDMDERKGWRVRKGEQKIPSPYQSDI
jgi:hypothetical protein